MAEAAALSVGNRWVASSPPYRPTRRPQASSGRPARQWATISMYKVADRRSTGEGYPRTPYGQGEETDRQAGGGPGGTRGRPDGCHEPACPEGIRVPGDVRVRDRAAGVRGEVAPGGEGADQRGLRPGRRRRDVALPDAHPALAVLHRLRVPRSGPEAKAVAAQSADRRVGGQDAAAVADADPRLALFP